jgi:signal peptidase
MNKKILDIFYWVGFTLIITTTGLVFASTVNNPLGIKSLVIQSSSMSPQLKTGGLILVKPSDQYEPGDVITFNSLLEGKKTITHRIIGAEYLEDGTSQYITKGDANEDKDASKVDKSLVLGKVFLSIPYLGYLTAFAKTQVGFLILIIIPATVFVVSEIQNIFKNLATLKEKKAI